MDKGLSKKRGAYQWQTEELHALADRDGDRASPIEFVDLLH